MNIFYQRCEYLVNPIGIDCHNPRLTWLINDDNAGSAQHAYQIVVVSDSKNCGNGYLTIWDSGKIFSDTALVHVPQGLLEPFTMYYWTVKVWKINNICAQSEQAFFETGMMSISEWKGNWISDSLDIDCKSAAYFRKEFSISKEVKKATAYIVAGGLFEMLINGEKVGDHFLDPMPTRYDRRNLYVTHNVTHLINIGFNAIGIELGNGWYNHLSKAVWNFDKAPWRARPKFCLDLHIKYTDGSVETITTGEGWKTILSPTYFNSHYSGERYNNNLVMPNWSLPKFNDSNWNDIIVVTAPSNNIVSQNMHPIRLINEVFCISFTKISANKYVFDIGKNISGITRLTVSGKTGTIIRLTHAERLYNNGNIDMSNIITFFNPIDEDDYFQTDQYTLNGNGVETFIPRFCYKGFRYIEVTSNADIDLNINSLCAYYVHSDVPKIGHIQTSNTILNKELEASDNSYLSNLFGLPTDCPTREKLGWTGDAIMANETGLFNFDTITIYEKWLADHRDEQQPNGMIPGIVPTSGWGYHFVGPLEHIRYANGTDYSSSMVIIPWNIYLFYGDSNLLKLCYTNMKRYVDFVDSFSNSNGLTDFGLGDWVPIKSKSNKELTSSVYFYTDALIVAKVAKLFNNHSDYEKYSSLAEKIKKSINNKFLNIDTGVYASGLQTEYAVPLYWGVVPENLVAKVAENLANKVISDDCHMDVGLLGAKAILNALSNNGYPELAYKVATQETFPSWGWWIVNGATTFYENFDLNSPNDISNNHIMFGEISAWCYKALGGINVDENKPGFKNIILKPHFIDNLNHVTCTFVGPYGTIESSWHRENGKILYHINVPPNSSAYLHLNLTNYLDCQIVLCENTEQPVVTNQFCGSPFILEAGKFIFVINSK